ncbi:hypothetical protein MSP8886_02288 [Marinomonas spartinae]|uniref:Uncharacterized protein n=1 Tax=Marinomonas spartinae TaxID=1792290 RepID=A0A1A8TIG3_9GAMM|nr:hypothetical protein [Marinomonas spartinae]SBS31944.1 hypothetical protein MSP8886_02288 [Marinomonas spartinae]
MYEQIEKPKENKSKAVANAVTQRKRSATQSFGFVDNRPDTIVQRKISIKKQPYTFTPYSNKDGNPYLTSKVDIIELDDTQDNINIKRKSTEIPATDYDGNKEAINQNIEYLRTQKVKKNGREFTIMPITTLSQKLDTPPDLKVLTSDGHAEKYNDIESEIIRKMNEDIDKGVDPMTSIASSLKTRVEPIVAMAEERRNKGSLDAYQRVTKKIKRTKKKVTTLKEKAAEKISLTKHIKAAITDMRYAGKGGKEKMRKHLDLAPSTKKSSYKSVSPDRE